MTLRRAGIVQGELIQEYPSQQFWDYFDPGGQTLVAIQCAYKGILQTFFNLGNSLSLPSISVQNAIADYSRLTPTWDECVIVCYSDTAIKVSLLQLVYDSCGEDSGTTLLPPIIEPPSEFFEPGEPILVSPPYDENDESEPYAPFEGDFNEVPPPPIINCQVIPVNLQYKFGSQQRNINVNVTAPVRVRATIPGTFIAIEGSTCSLGNLLNQYNTQPWFEATGSPGTITNIQVSPSNVPIVMVP